MQRRDGHIYINNVNGQQIVGRIFGGLGNLYKHTHTHTHTQVGQTYLPLLKYTRTRTLIYGFSCFHAREVGLFFSPSDGGGGSGRYMETNIFLLTINLIFKNKHL